MRTEHSMRRCFLHSMNEDVILRVPRVLCLSAFVLRARDAQPSCAARAGLLRFAGPDAGRVVRFTFVSIAGSSWTLLSASQTSTQGHSAMRPFKPRRMRLTRPGSCGSSGTEPRFNVASTPIGRRRATPGRRRAALHPTGLPAPAQRLAGCASMGRVPGSTSTMVGAEAVVRGWALRVVIRE
jgi:hypothetical protein